VQIKPQTLSLLTDQFAVCRLEPQAAVPAWAMGGPFFCITRTADELSIVCAEGAVPPGVRSEGGWRAFKLEGPFDFTQTGILASVLSPLAEAGVGVFALSTYDTDYVLIKGSQLEQAAAALEACGHSVQR
jgi:hypothetical protein